MSRLMHFGGSWSARTRLPREHLLAIFDAACHSSSSRTPSIIPSYVSSRSAYTQRIHQMPFRMSRYIYIIGILSIPRKSTIPFIPNSEYTRAAFVARNTWNTRGCDLTLGMINKMMRIFHSISCLRQVPHRIIQPTVSYGGER
jgi:hypothetical protein